MANVHKVAVRDALRPPEATVNSARREGTSAPRSRAEPFHRPMYIEEGFPFRELSFVIRAERRSRDPVYGVHPWPARRPPSLMRGILIAATLPTGSDKLHYWNAFESDSTALYGFTVADPFMGGGATLVEAARLGASVVGSDVDPMAVAITKCELSRFSLAEFEKLSTSLLGDISREFGWLYPAGATGHPLHYFSLARIRCPSCDFSTVLYRDLILARGVDKRGSVARPPCTVVFCPDCLKVQTLVGSNRKRFTCCGRSHGIAQGNFRKLGFHCGECGAKHSHTSLKTGGAPRELIGIEVSIEREHRRFRAPTPEDLDAIRASRELCDSEARKMRDRDRPLSTNRADPRPLSYGITSHAQLFTPRQRLVLRASFQWIDECSASPPVKHALRIAVSSAVATNNVLCGYARDYGRLSALFSVKGFPLPLLGVELNPLHPHGGRGTLKACLKRVQRYRDTPPNRNVWSPLRRKPEKRPYVGEVQPANVSLVNCSADKLATRRPASSVDLVVFDPPYFDFIPYQDWSEVFRGWWTDHVIKGTPLYRSNGSIRSDFSSIFSRTLASMQRLLREGGPLIFTYHSSNPAAWQPIGEALDEARLRITAVWPVLSDGHMGHHSHDGNCEWDLVLVCRPKALTEEIRCPHSVNKWKAHLAPLIVRDADATSFRHALNLCNDRFGRLIPQE